MYQSSATSKQALLLTHLIASLVNRWKFIKILEPTFILTIAVLVKETPLKEVNVWAIFCLEYGINCDLI